jgi:Holliday junction DNA helicase RuvA
LIVKLKGIVDEVVDDQIYLDIAGVVYGVYTNLEEIEVDKELNLYISEVIREDSYKLYGFITLNEKRVFEELLKVSGVGAVVGLSVLKTFKIEELAEIVSENSEKLLTKVPKIGIKSAKKIIMELSSKSFIKEFQKPDSSAKEIDLASQALQSLGFSEVEVRKAIANCESKNHKDLIREALSKLKT